MRSWHSCQCSKSILLMRSKSISPRILILCYSELNRDPRVLRQIEALQHIGTIITAGLQPSKHPAESLFIPLSFHFRFSLKKSNSSFSAHIGKWIIDPFMLFITKLFQFYYLKIKKDYDKFHWTPAKKQAFNNIRREDFDLIIANDMSALALSVHLKNIKGAKLCYDAHEYSPLEYDNDPEWLRTKSPYITHLCKKYMPQADYCTTIGKMIAEKYYELLGIRFGIIYNAPAHQQLKPIYRGDNKIQCVHQGVATRIREIEHMISAFKTLGDPYELHLYLLPSEPDYYAELKSLAVEAGNVWLHEPVATAAICTTINRYDILLNFIPPVNFNYFCGLPNKFFEAVQARLMLVCGPLKEQEELINQFGLGTVSAGFSSKDIVDTLRSIDLNTIDTCKQKADEAAKILSSETIMQSFQQQMQQLIN